MIHFDIRSRNIMIVNKRESLMNFKLIDFGLMERKPTKSLVKFQCPAYQAPEVFFGIESYNKIDVWSLGIVIVEMLIGHWPFGIGCARTNPKFNSQVVSLFNIIFG